MKNAIQEISQSQKDEEATQGKTEGVLQRKIKLILKNAFDKQR